MAGFPYIRSLENKTIDKGVFESKESLRIGSYLSSSSGGAGSDWLK